MEAKLTTTKILKITAKHFGLTLNVLRSRTRKREIAVPRQIAMTLAYELTGDSLATIGRQVDRDHATVLHAKRVTYGNTHWSFFGATIGEHLKALRARLNDEKTSISSRRLQRRKSPAKPKKKPSRGQRTTNQYQNEIQLRRNRNFGLWSTSQNNEAARPLGRANAALLRKFTGPTGGQKGQ